MAFLPSHCVMNLKSHYYRNGFYHISLTINYIGGSLWIWGLFLWGTHSLLDAIAAFMDMLLSHDWAKQKEAIL